MSKLPSIWEKQIYTHTHTHTHATLTEKLRFHLPGKSGVNVLYIFQTTN